jgi:hypothetical protein
MALIGSGLIKFDISWTKLKSIVSNKNLSIQFDESSTAYDIFAVDGSIVYYVILFKVAVPDSNYDQAQNDIDKADFEANYKNITTNRSTTPSTAMDGYSVTTTNPTLIAGTDGYVIRNIKTDTSGRLAIVGLGTAGSPSGGIISIQGVVGGTAIPISGSVSATNPSVSATGSAIPSSATMVGGSVTTAIPTYTSGNLGAFSLTTDGYLRVFNYSAAGNTVTQGTSPWVTNISQFGGSNVVTGTGTGGAGIPRVTVSSDSSIIATQNTAANLRSQTASESSTGSSTPSVAGLSGGAVTTVIPTYTSGNLGALSLTTDGYLRVFNYSSTGSTVTQGTSPWVTNVSQFGGSNVVTGTGTGGAGIPRITVSSDSSIIATQNTAANLNATVVQGTASNLNATIVGTGTDNTANSTAKLPVIAAVANTSAPSWSTGNMVPLSVDTSGNLRITGSISATNPSVSTVIATPPSSATYIGARANTAAPTWTDGYMVPLSVDTSGALRITGSISATNPSVSTTNSSPPASATYIGGSVTTSPPVYTSGRMNALSLTTDGYLRTQAAVIQKVVASTSNNTTTPLGAGATFTGIGESTLSVAGIQLNVFSDVASAQYGCRVQQSMNNVDWDIVDYFTIEAGKGFGTTIQATASFFRIVYTNGPDAQSVFRLQVALCPMVEALPRALGSRPGQESLSVVFSYEQPLLPSSGYMSTSYQPDLMNVVDYTTPTVLLLDASGRLEAHATSTTDEGSYRDDFIGSSLITPITGTVTFTNDSTTVTGSGTSFASTLHMRDFIKKTADDESLYAEIEEILSDTELILSDPYAGTTESTTAVESSWRTFTATGGSINIASSLVSIASGTTSGQKCFIERYGDYLPYTSVFHFSISQRIANQTIIVGFQDGYADFTTTPIKQITVQFSGTDNTKATFVSSFGSTAADRQTTIVTLPYGGTTNTLHSYKLDLSGNQASLTIDGVTVVTHNLHLPGPYDLLNIYAGIINTGTAGSSTTLAIDALYFYNTNRVQVDNDYLGEPMPVRAKIIPFYGNANQPITITMNGLTNNSARSSAFVDNTTALTSYEDVQLYIKIRTGSSGTSATGYINVYGYGSDGYIYPENITGTDAAVTLTNPPNLFIIAQMNAVANNTTYTAGPVSFCRMYGLDRLPPRWGIVVVNKTGATLNATSGNFWASYQGVNGQLAV